MVAHGAFETLAFGDSCAHVIGSQIIHQRIFHHERRQCETASQIGRQRQRGVIQHIDDFLAERVGVEIVVDKSAERKPVELRCKNRNECDAYDIARHCVTKENQHRRHVIEQRAVTNRFRHAERYADAIGDDERGDAIKDRDRKALPDEIPNRVVIARRIAEVEMQDAPQPLRVAYEHGLVETVVGLQLRELFFVERIATARARCVLIALLQRGLCHHAFDRSARHDARDGEDEQCDADKGRNDQQQAAQKIGGHRMAFIGPETGAANLTSSVAFIQVAFVRLGPKYIGYIKQRTRKTASP